MDHLDRDDQRLAIPTSSEGRHPAVGQTSIIMLGVTLGILLMSLQLWLLTLAFDLYLLGHKWETFRAAVFSGLVFVGGLIMLRLLDRPSGRTGQGRSGRR